LAPCAQIAENAGVSGEIVVGKVAEASDYNFGYNAQTAQYVDMMTAGIIDPAKVVKTAIMAASSTAGVMLTTGAVMAEIPEEKSESKMPGGMPGMM
jgi:chaperonin GroEL